MLVNLVIVGRNSLVLEIGLLVKLVIVNGLLVMKFNLFLE